MSAKSTDAQDSISTLIDSLEKMKLIVQESLESGLETGSESSENRDTIVILKSLINVMNVFQADTFIWDYHRVNDEYELKRKSVYNPSPDFKIVYTSDTAKGLCLFLTGSLLGTAYYLRPDELEPL